MDRLHAHDGQTLSELCRHFDMTRQGVTQHLSVLEAANLEFERPRLKALRELKRRLEAGGEN